jgi:hypothetical protein
MNLDAQLQFSAAQAITADAASTNVIDLGAVRQIGVGEAMSILICVIVAADSTTGDETYSFELQTDDNSSFSSATTLSDTVLAASVLTIGSVHAIPLPRTGLERYIRLNYDVGGTTPTITVSAWLQPTSMVAGLPQQYADAITISM